MSSLLLFASTTTVPAPDTGSTGLLLSLGIICVGLIARFIKNRKH